MERELYQLVAITKNNMEYVVELKNENKKNRGKLEFIDNGTTRFKNEESLAEYLYNAGKIPTKEVIFAIKYNNKGAKYLPLIFNDKELTYVSKNVANDDVFPDYVFHFLKLLEVSLSDPVFYNYLIRINSRNEREVRNGNYINQKLITSIIEYYNTYIKTNNIDENRADLQYSILKELYNYKQLRTLRMFYLNYKNIIKKENDIIPAKDVNKTNIEEMPDIPEDLDYAYKNGGMDEVYNIADLDDLISSGVKFK